MTAHRRDGNGYAKYLRYRNDKLGEQVASIRNDRFRILRRDPQENLAWCLLFQRMHNDGYDDDGTRDHDMRYVHAQIINHETAARWRIIWLRSPHSASATFADIGVDCKWECASTLGE
jgi:hypothetical protein